MAGKIISDLALKEALYRLLQKTPLKTMVDEDSFLLQNRVMQKRWQRFYRKELKRHTRPEGAPAVKYLPPRLHLILSRPRLHGLLEEGRDKKLLVVHAQAGQGKTTLVADYLQQVKAAYAWLRLDVNDRDPIFFLHDILESIEVALPNFPRDTFQQLLTWEESDDYGPGFLDQYAEILASNLDTPFYIVLDDFHLIGDSKPLVAVLDMLLPRLAPNLHVIIISRTFPTLALSRWRVEQEVVEITGEELKFRLEEIDKLFNQIFSMDLDRELVETLARISEGWIASLILLSESFQRLKPHQQKRLLEKIYKTQAFDHINEYLSREVFDGQPESLRNFLVKTSILEHIPDELAVILTGEDKAHQLLAELEARHLFTSAVDENRTIYQYHHLFREFLRARLTDLLNEQDIKSLYFMAGKFFLDQGDQAAAIEYFLQARAYESAAAAIDEAGVALLKQHKSETLRRWIKSLPLATMDHHPRLYYYSGRLARATDLPLALKHMEKAAAGFQLGEDRAGEMLALKECLDLVLQNLGPLNTLRPWAERAQELLTLRPPEEDLEARVALLSSLALVELWPGANLRQGLEKAREAYHLALQLEAPLLQAAARVNMILGYVLTGDFIRAAELINQTKVQLNEMDNITLRPILWYLQGQMELFQGEWSKAEKSLDLSLKFARQVDVPVLSYLASDALARLYAMQGRENDLEELLFQKFRHPRALDLTNYEASMRGNLSLLHFRQQDFRRALAEIRESMDFLERQGDRLLLLMDRLLMGAILRESGDFDEANRQLFRMVKDAQEAGADYFLVSGYIQLALMFFAEKKTRLGHEYLERAMELAVKNNYYFFYLWQKESIVRLVEAAEELKLFPAYVKNLALKLKMSGLKPEASVSPGSELAAGAPAGRLEVRSFGPLELKRDGKDAVKANWRKSKAAVLFRMLVAHRERPITREEVIAYLWPGKDEEQTNANFNTTLHRLRHSLEPQLGKKEKFQLIHHIDNALVLNRESIWLDVEEFEHAVNKAQALEKAGKLEEMAETLEYAAELYRGDFLPGDERWPRLEEERERLRKDYIQVQLKLASYYRPLGQASRVLGPAEKAHALAPEDDAVNRMLTELYVHFDLPEKALSLYQKLEKNLKKKNRSPSPELQALAQRAQALRHR